jgi:hypothetical protein
MTAGRFHPRKRHRDSAVPRRPASCRIIHHSQRNFGSFIGHSWQRGISGPVTCLWGRLRSTKKSGRRIWAPCLTCFLQSNERKPWHKIEGDRTNYWAAQTEKKCLLNRGHKGIKDNRQDFCRNHQMDFGRVRQNYCFQEQRYWKWLHLVSQCPVKYCTGHWQRDCPKEWRS